MILKYNSTITPLTYLNSRHTCAKFNTRCFYLVLYNQTIWLRRFNCFDFYAAGGWLKRSNTWYCVRLCKTYL